MQPDTHQGFAAALLSPEAPVPQNVVDPSGRIAPKRFAVYRNNVTVSLIEAMKSTFPAVMALVGEAFFADMARRFVRLSPPQSPLLFEYGRNFADFLATFESVRRLPFLPDVARLDRAWLDAYHAADADPFDAAALAGLDEPALMAVRFVASPATRLMRSGFPLVTIWSAARAGEQPRFGDSPQAEWALVKRPDLDVGVAALDPVSGAFFAALIDGNPLGDAAEQALSLKPDFDLGGALAKVMSCGCFSRIETANRE